MKKIILVFNNKSFVRKPQTAAEVAYIKSFGGEYKVNSGDIYEFLTRKFKEFTGEDLRESIDDQIYEEKSRVIYCRLNKLDEFIDMLNGFDKDQLCCLDEVRSEDSKNTLWVNKFQYE